MSPIGHKFFNLKFHVISLPTTRYLWCICFSRMSDDTPKGFIEKFTPLFSGIQKIYAHTHFYQYTVNKKKMNIKTLSGNQYVI